MFYFFALLLFLVTHCLSMNSSEYKKIQPYLKGQKKLEKLVAHYQNENFKEATLLLTTYKKKYLTTSTPYLLYTTCFNTENTILHEIAKIMNKNNFKELFLAIHTILQYHPELATQENSDFCLPLNYAKEIPEHQMEKLCCLMVEPEKFETPEKYFLEKFTQTKSIPIQQSYNEKNIKEDRDDREENKVKKASSFTLFSFSKVIKRSHSNSMSSITHSNHDQN